MPTQPKDTDMNRSKLPRVVLLALTMFSACAEPSAPRGAISPPLLTISDAAHGGANEHFYFLPPMVPAPAYDGTFDVSASPTVEVCEVGTDAYGAAECSATVASFAMGGDTGSESVRVDPEGEHYIVNWDTNACASGTCSLDPSLTYRIRVLDGDSELGYADVDVVSSGGQLRNVNTNEYLALIDGRTLPIKFRIERQPGWRLLAAHGAGPDLTGFAFFTTYAEQLDAIFLLKNLDGEVGELWRLDLATDSWSQMPLTNWPTGSSAAGSGKFRRIVYDPGGRRLLTYYDGLGQVWAVSENGGAWVEQGSNVNSDEYYVGAAFFDPVTQQLGVFGGYGFGTWRNTLWMFDRTTLAWRNESPSGEAPWPRIAPEGALDVANARLYVTEGEGSASGSQAAGGQLLSDLWVLDLRAREWTNLVPVGAAVINRQGTAMEHVGPTNSLYRFGGHVSGGAGPLSSELLRLDLDGATLAWSAVPVTGDSPAARLLPGLHHDSRRNRLVLVGGYHLTGAYSDVWGFTLP